jgi:hypothetical protein
MHLVRLSQTAVPTILLIFINGGLEEAPRLIDKFRRSIEFTTVFLKYSRMRNNSSSRIFKRTLVKRDFAEPPVNQN